MTPSDRPSGRRSARLEERTFHAWLRATLPWGHRSLLPLGDDAAALVPPPRAAVVVSTDALVLGTHFLAESPPALLGAAAVGVGLSDVASKGARPYAVLLAVIAPASTPERWARKLVLGAERTARRFGAEVVGGDTKPGPTTAVVGTVLGWGAPRHLVGRSGARPGDVVVTTGVVGRGGAASVGLAGSRLERLRAVRAMLELSPRVGEGVALARYASAMLDTSDGIADASRLLAEASAVRLEIDERELPWDDRLVLLSPGRRRTLGFYGGDYELLATVGPGRLDAARRDVARSGTRLTAIGVVRPGRGVRLRGRRGTGTMPRAGWRPFGAR